MCVVGVQAEIRTGQLSNAYSECLPLELICSFYGHRHKSPHHHRMEWRSGGKWALVSKLLLRILSLKPALMLRIINILSRGMNVWDKCIRDKNFWFTPYKGAAKKKKLDLFRGPGLGLCVCVKTWRLMQTSANTSVKGEFAQHTTQNYTYDLSPEEPPHVITFTKVC
jgi:hypothetical protein